MIEFREVTKIYSGLMRNKLGKVVDQKAMSPAIDRLSLIIETGSFVFVVGPSGAGKTTLTRLITREEKPSSGSVVIDGYDIEELTDKNLPYYRRQIGIVFQDFKLFPSMTAIENIAFAAIAVGVPSKVALERATKLLSVVGMTNEHASLFPNELSGGECQRVAIARAIVNFPKILIADEPTGNLDEKLSREIIELLKFINFEMNTTVLVITHDMTLVEPDANVLRLDKGRLLTNA